LPFPLLFLAWFVLNGLEAVLVVVFRFLLSLPLDVPLFSFTSVFDFSPSDPGDVVHQLLLYRVDFFFFFRQESAP